MKLSLPPNLVEKLVWVPVISFRKISFSIPVTRLMPYYAEAGRSRPLIAWIYRQVCWVAKFLTDFHINVA
jgi:hypothetical protein